MTRQEQIDYWLQSSEDNFSSMNNMFVSNEYVWALFVGHLCIEKLLKAYHTKTTDEHVIPRIHDLYKLALRCNLVMTDLQMDSLQYVTLFNIEARYEEHKREFYRKCTKEFTAEAIASIKELRTWLLEKINN